MVEAFNANSLPVYTLRDDAYGLLGWGLRFVFLTFFDQVEHGSFVIHPEGKASEVESYYQSLMRSQVLFFNYGIDEE